MRGSRFLSSDDKEEDKIRYHQGLSGNEIVQTLAFRMIEYADQIDELLPDIDKRTPPRVNKILNTLFKMFSKDLRTLVSITQTDIKDKKVLSELKQLLDKRYGTYNLKLITNYAHDYFNELRRLKIILISIEHEEDTARTKFNKY